ncbi:MAG: hypothetical protein LBV53_01440 [Mycoplasmataceae bacterium]|jgi:hypothetical protein|nr:hypothetical protein [Mycoplasmataceae bacterium]
MESKKINSDIKKIAIAMHEGKDLHCSTNMKYLSILVTIILGPIIGSGLYFCLNAKLLTSADAKSCRTAIWVTIAIYIILYIILFATGVITLLAI